MLVGLAVRSYDFALFLYQCFCFHVRFLARVHGRVPCLSFGVVLLGTDTPVAVRTVAVEADTLELFGSCEAGTVPQGVSGGTQVWVAVVVQLGLHKQVRVPGDLVVEWLLPCCSPGYCLCSRAFRRWLHCDCLSPRSVGDCGDMLAPLPPFLCFLRRCLRI